MLLSAQKRALEMVAAGESLTAILEELCDTIDAQSPGIISFVMLVDPDGKHLRPTAGRRIPSGFASAISPFPIGPSAGSWGTAAFLKKRVVVSDIASDPLADLAELPYTDMVVREAMRLYPPAAGFAREPIEDVHIGGYNVPKGSLVTVNTYALHHDARFFDEPERFNPERFSAGWEERIPRYAFLPFGGGPRVCIGNGFAMMEVRLILATVVQRCQLLLEPGQEIVPMQLVTVRPKHGIRMRMAVREHANCSIGAIRHG
jgi:hypothetical protein